MLEVDVMADRATLLHLVVRYKPVQGYLMMWRKHLDSRAWVAQRTAQVLARGAQEVPGGFVDVNEVSHRMVWCWGFAWGGVGRDGVFFFCLFGGVWCEQVGQADFGSTLTSLSLLFREQCVRFTRGGPGCSRGCGV